MRPFTHTSHSTNYSQSSGSENFKPQARGSTSTNPNEISRIRSDAMEGVDISSASIESELKRIESFLTSDSKAFLKEFGINFGRSEKTQDTSDFNTASFNSKDDIRAPHMSKVTSKMPALFEINSDDAPSVETSSYNLQGLGEYTSKESPEKGIMMYKDPQISAGNFQDRLKRLRAEQRVNTSLQSEGEDGKLETGSTFGMKNYAQIEDQQTFRKNKTSKQMPSLSEFPTIKENVRKQKPFLKYEKKNEVQYDEEESSQESSGRDLRIRETSPMSATERQKTIFQTISTEIETPDIDYYLKNLMIPRRMKISIGGVPFQEVIFVLALKFFDKSVYFENFVFEWLDVKTTVMIGYIKCEYIKYVHKQAQKRFNIACKAPKMDDEDEEVLHHVHIEADSAQKCDLYVNGLNAVIKYMEKSVKSPGSKGS